MLAKDSPTQHDQDEVMPAGDSPSRPTLPVGNEPHEEMDAQMTPPAPEGVLPTDEEEQPEEQPAAGVHPVDLNESPSDPRSLPESSSD